MSADNITLQNIAAFAELDVENLTQNHVKETKPSFSASLRKHYTYAKRWAFSTYVASKKCPAHSGTDASGWHCCGQTFESSGSVHKHVSRTHENEVLRHAEAILQLILSGTEDESPALESSREEEPVNVTRWIPDTAHVEEEHLVKGQGEVLLFYCYTQLPDPQLICTWQKVLCQRLHLTGKVRVAVEGINGTVGGTKVATGLYIQAMLAHPVFRTMMLEDFKRSEGGADCFTELKVGLYKEIVPMGVDPDAVSFRQAGVHLEPEEFHREVEILLSKGDSCNDTILLDCRNFYESKIGQFSKCLAPDIRKFSYFPDYVDKNLELFRDKKVLMYCTGGIRCERGSAYLRSKEVCKEVYQLKGGIHKYLERYPDGFYRGKLFVFDERYAISFNSDIISDCRYCGSPWDQYQLCSTRLCCQLVLSCPSCRHRGHTACCLTCQRKGEALGGGPPPPLKEECECTDTRPRIPQDAL